MAWKSKTLLNLKDPLKVKTQYRFDAYLLHLVQETTKRNSAEILNFFYELGGQVAELGTEKRTGQGIRKNIIEYFPGTSIPFHMQVKGDKRQEWDQATRAYSANAHMLCYVEVGFPDKLLYIKNDELENVATQLMEKALLGGVEPDIKPFPKPEIKTPKMYLALMEEFAKPKGEV